MKQNNKRIVPRAFLIYSGINIFVYALSHIAYLFENDTIGVTFEYISYYTSATLEFLAPPLLATLMLVLAAKEGTKMALFHILLVSTARIFYTLPYYYLIFIYNYRYDSLESILVAFAASVFIIILTALGAYISFAAALLVLKRKEKMTRDEIISALPKIVSEPTTSDFLGKSGLPILIFALLRFGLSLLSEIVDTVMFFVRFRSDYTLTEIATMLINYVLLFAFLILSYYLSSRFKNKLVTQNNVFFDDLKTDNE